MLFLAFFLSVLSAPGLSSAGEIVLYSGNTCTSTSRTIFSANSTVGCQQRDLTNNFNLSASTSRNIGSSCVFNLYSDTNCANLITKITSSGPAKSCVALARGPQSYKITCGNPIPGNLIRPMDDSIYSPSYFQPLATYRGKPSGHDSFGIYLGVRGNSGSRNATGNPSSVGVKLATAFFNQVPTGAVAYTTSVVDAGTLYKVTLTGYIRNNYTAEIALRTMGYAAFGSLMADIAKVFNTKPYGYLDYLLDNYDLGQEMGEFNMTFVAP